MYTQDQIAEHYDNTLRHYRFVWDMDCSMALHYGFWGPGVRSLRGALEHENEVLANRLELHANSHVLDAGCGVGGSSLYLAQRFGCRITGITLSTEQLRVCHDNARQAGLEQRLQFELRDYHQTGYDDASFDVVWAIESFCHSRDKAAFLREARRILKPGGKLIIADAFKMPDLPQSDEAALVAWLNGWAVDDIETVESMHAKAALAGFADSQMEEVSELIAPSSLRLYWLSWPALMVVAIQRLRGIRKPMSEGNVWAAHRQYAIFRQRKALYGIFEARR